MLRRLPPLLVVLTIVCGSLAFAEVEFSFGPLPGFSGVAALGEHPPEENCTACHLTYDDAGEVPNLNLPGGGLTIDVPEFYLPGTTLPVTVTLASDSTAGSPNRRWGFQLTAVGSVDGEGLGSFVIPPGDSVKVVSVGPEYGNRSYIEHTSIGTRQGLAGAVSWTFEWQAPIVPPGTVRFYAAGNAANGGGSPDGDFVYTAVDSTMEVVTAVARMSWGRLKRRFR